MKKNLLALSVAAALGAGVSAAQAFQPGGAEATGNALVVPYYTVQNGNATLINIVNTDTTNGKAVKIRFRGAERSDDVFDFQVFLSPADMWTANISQGPDGRARLTTNDNSCTLPANVNESFITFRLDGTPAERAAGTREGYVEIINMGDIIEGSSSSPERALYTATKHVDGVAPCTDSVLRTVLNSGNANATTTTGLDPDRLSSYATGGLFANATIINVDEAAAWTVNAQPVQPNWTQQTRYWPQTATPYTGGAGALAEVTLDWIFLGGEVTPAQYDFPDLSTPRFGTNPVDQYEDTNYTIGLYASLSNEYITDASIFAATDWVLSFPTRRYAVEGRDFSETYGDEEDGVLPPFYEVINQTTGCLDVADFSIFDREERTTTTGVVISPGEPTSLSLCGEVAVISFNTNGASASAALGAELTLNDATIPYADGWASVGFNTGLPVIAYAFVKANNGGAGATNYNFGGVWKHRSDWYDI